MHSPAVMMSDIKALLTLWLLKAGTTSAEIRTSLLLAATSRAMATDEHGYGRSETANLAQGSLAPAIVSNIARLYPNSDAEIAARKTQQAVEAMNSDVMALITLSLLKVGTSSDEIQQALRLAALSRAPLQEEKAQPARPAPEPISVASKQALLNELLAPNGGKELASA